MLNLPKTINRSRSQANITPSILSVEDYERIRRNCNLLSPEEVTNKSCVLKSQKESTLAKAKALKERLIQIDKCRSQKNIFSEAELEKKKKNQTLLDQAQRLLDQNEDCVKDMNHYVLYAKIAAIRDKQLEEHKQMEKMYKKKEEKLDMMMELERLKELQMQHDREYKRKKMQREGSSVVIDQIKDREIERLHQKEIVRKEGELMVQRMRELEEEDKRNLEKKRLHNAQMAKEVEETNKTAAFAREKKILEEKELDLKILKYNIEKNKREEEYLAEQKRIKEEKEKEVQRLREKQERAIDKQVEIDELRAQRAFEESERKIRANELAELNRIKKMQAELIAANEIQKEGKRQRLFEMAKHETEEYNKIIAKQLEDVERERKAEEEKRKMRYEHAEEVRRQIRTKEELNKIGRREVLEEGRAIRQRLDDYYIRMEKIKQEKIQELKDLNVHPKYVASLEKYKIV
ncbi:MAG: trichohyalin-plectin-homology domain domain-containing protein [archaeon]|nr:trichohyalin-plectin-homology domain domain-containing protein [archaeon]